MGNPEKGSIFFLGSQMAVGGGQEILFSQASWFHGQGYRVVAAFFYDREKLYSQWRARCEFPLLDLQSWEKGGGWRNYFRLVRGLVRLYHLLRRERFAVVETFTHHANLLGMPVAWLAGVRVRVASHHGRGANFSPSLIYFHRQVVNHGIATSLVAVSKQVQGEAIAQEHIRPDRITVITNGINARIQTPISEAEKASLRQSLGVEKSDPLLLTVARLTPEKGHTYLLAAIPKILEVNPEAHFVFAGDGPLREELQVQASNSGIGHAVSFLGTRMDIIQLLQIVDVFVLPSLTEGLPVAMLEAMLAGKPVVASQVGGLAEVIRNGENGLLIPPGDPEALSRSLNQLLQDKQTQEQLGVAGKATVISDYSAERMCREYEDLFNELG